MLQKLIIGLLLTAHSAGFAQLKQSATIGQQTFAFIDPSRHRPVKTEIWYPTIDSLKKSDQFFSPFVRQYTVQNGRLPSGRLPLIMVSHGTGGGRLTLEWLAQRLARKGFIVAAVDHYGNTFDNKIPLEFLKPWERPLDISFALTSLLQHESLKAIIDPNRIGAMGFSFGGYTVIALAGAVTDFTMLLTYYQTTGRHELEVPELPGVSAYVDDPALLEAAKKAPSLKDSRIKAFLSISPALGPGFTQPEQVKNIQAPVYIIGSQSDSIAPVVTNSRHYHTLLKGSQYYEFSGKTGHYVMLNEAIEELKKSDPIYFADDKSVDRQQVHGQVIELAVDFFNSKLK